VLGISLVSETAHLTRRSSGLDFLPDICYLLAMPDGEVLLVGGGAAVAATGRWRVISRVDPDVVVLLADAHDVPELARHARFAISRSPDGETQVFGDERAIEELDEGARLFVKAWRERVPSKPHRPGEGLPWDAPGFEPPGPPSR
jgi:hypothetical protein